jgi:hypothetical protein
MRKAKIGTLLTSIIDCTNTFGVGVHRQKTWAVSNTVIA